MRVPELRDVGLGEESLEGDESEEVPNPTIVDEVVAIVAAIFPFLFLLRFWLTTLDSLCLWEKQSSGNSSGGFVLLHNLH